MASPTSRLAIHWFRRDLRLRDNPALAAAAREYDAVLPVFIWAPEEEHPWEPGAASRWWLHHSLTALEAELQQQGLPLLLRRGSSLEVLQKLIEESGATAVFWNRLYEPRAIERDTKVKKKLREQDIEVESYNGSLLLEPWELQTSSGGPYQVFTPFWRKLQEVFEFDGILQLPRTLAAPPRAFESASIEGLELLPKISWDAGFYECWTPGEQGAKKRLEAFVKRGVAEYSTERDIPAHEGTSGLSPHLHFGELSPRQVWDAVLRGVDRGELTRKQAEPFLRQIGWRDFGHHLLFHFPETPREPLHEKFRDFPWAENDKLLQAWQRGRTGYPFVDAGMRELWKTGVMHNRLRMVVASFLVKHLLQPWQRGAEWFWDTLVDADLANNTLGWQWTAGCGADAAPYFRVFNPFGQGERFDADGSYIRHWLPELAALPNKYLHRPWEAPKHVLQEAGVELGKDYPHPIVDHKEARESALEAYEQIRRK